MIDPVARPIGAYSRELAKTRELRARLARAWQVGPAWTCDASLYHAPRAADTGLLLVGDAASFIEPLSSAGVKKALTSGWRAAVVVNTCLTRPEMASHAAEFHDRREREVAIECARLARRFFSEAAAAYDHAFWSVRAESGSDPKSGSASGSDPKSGSESGSDPKSGSDPGVPDDLLRDAGVRTAFETLRRAPGLRLRRSPALRIDPAATIEGREVVLRDGVVLPGSTTPIRFAGGVNLPALIQLAGECDEMSSLIAGYTSTIGPAPVEGLLAGLSLLVAHRALIQEGVRS